MTPLRLHARGLTAAVRLMPGARREGFHGVVDGLLKISVTAVPEHGKANKALTAFLAKWWGVPKNSLSLLSGEAHRQKVVLVEGDGKALLARVEALLQHP
jgi:uncharacterized protein YggU (UPF0235/DUF167 family)